MTVKCPDSVGNAQSNKITSSKIFLRNRVRGRVVGETGAKKSKSTAKKGEDSLQVINRSTLPYDFGKLFLLCYQNSCHSYTDHNVFKLLLPRAERGRCSLRTCFHPGGSHGTATVSTHKNNHADRLHKRVVCHEGETGTKPSNGGLERLGDLSNHSSV